MTEEEQVEAIKAVLKKYYQPIIAVFLGVMVCMSGYRYWQWHHTQLQNQASVMYESLMNAVTHDEKSSMHAYAERLIQTYGQTVYADVARLVLAKCLLEEAHAEAAKAMLSTLSKKGHSQSLKQVATLRLARILMSEKKYSEALAALKGLDKSAYAPVALELTGNCYFAMHQLSKAKTAYQLAIKQAKAKGMTNPILDAKLNEI